MAEAARLESLNGREAEARAAIDSVKAASKVLSSILGPNATAKTNYCTDTSANLNCNGMAICLSFTTSHSFSCMDYDNLFLHVKTETEYRIVRYNHRSDQIIVKNPVLAEAILNNHTALEELTKEAEEIGGTIRGILNNCTSIKKLRELWPECDAYLPEGIENANIQASINLPVSIDTLNAKLTKYSAAA
ncbi:hypothetical protein HSBAA_29170 [Vreelandella sulfidaeris]|uniref:Nucleotide modification associated domain-containing protein n=1 Tax=Vreelandella sulfidaeris TaxID=115553 RepID=A0A455UAL4_9GAMM|nr:hypothetical protein HSBAA_29170 [Halomonas sulfidaeris]